VITPKALFDARPSILGLRQWWRGRYTFNEIIPNLFMGGFPRPNGSILQALLELRIDHVLSATFDEPTVPGATLTRAPFLDISLPKNLTPLYAGAHQAADMLREGKRVYVSCGHGHDRSGILVGLILHNLHPHMSGEEIIQLIRARRGSEALHNRRFARFVRELPAA